MAVEREGVNQSKNVVCMCMVEAGVMAEQKVRAAYTSCFNLLRRSPEEAFSSAVGRAEWPPGATRPVDQS